MANEGKVVVTLYKTKCRLCGHGLHGTSKEMVQKALGSHIDNDCPVASSMREWERKGIYKQMVAALQGQELSGKLAKLVKQFGFDQVKDELMKLEDE